MDLCIICFVQLNRIKASPFWYRVSFDDLPILTFKEKTRFFLDLLR